MGKMFFYPTRKRGLVGYEITLIDFEAARVKQHPPNLAQSTRHNAGRPKPGCLGFEDAQNMFKKLNLKPKLASSRAP